MNKQDQPRCQPFFFHSLGHYHQVKGHMVSWVSVPQHPTESALEVCPYPPLRPIRAAHTGRLSKSRRLPGVSRARLPGVSRARLPDSQACLNVPDHGVDNSLFSQPLDGNSLIISDTNHCASRLDRKPDNRRSSDRLRPDSHSTRPPFRSCDTPL